MIKGFGVTVLTQKDVLTEGFPVQDFRVQGSVHYCRFLHFFMVEGFRVQDFSVNKVF